MRGILRATLLSIGWLPIWSSADVITSLAQISPSAASTCGGCFILADVLEVFFATEVVTQTITAAPQVISGRNGTRFTTTLPQSFLLSTEAFTTTDSLGQLTINPSGIVTPGPGGFLTESTITINGVVLTAPTAYALFNGASIISTTANQGSCVPVTNTLALATAFMATYMPGEDPVSFLSSAEKAFSMAYTLAITCSAVGVIASTTTLTTLSTSSQTVVATMTSAQTSIASVIPPATASSTSTPTSIPQMPDMLPSSTTTTTSTATIISTAPASPSSATQASVVSPSSTSSPAVMASGSSTVVVSTSTVYTSTSTVTITATTMLPPPLASTCVCTPVSITSLNASGRTTILFPTSTSTVIKPLTGAAVRLTWSDQLIATLTTFVIMLGLV